MKNKGFTLIELLAVIVILAIIALIATPVILGIIEDSRNSAKLNSAQYVIDGVQTAYGVAYAKSYEADSTKNIVAKTAGIAPSTYHIGAELSFKNIESVTPASNKITVVTKDGVTCEFNVDATTKMLTSNDCGLTGKITATDIGKVN